MKKRFVKVALLSLVTCASSGAFVACSDDDWKSPVETVETSVEGINKTVGQLDEQIKALDAKIAESKAAADAAAQAAADAMAAAQAADTKAEDAKKYADEAAQKYAEEAAQRAIQTAAEQLKAEIEAVKALIQANADAIASNKQLIDGNSEAIKENAGKIEGNTKAIEDLLNALNEYKGENDSKIQEILDKLDAAGVDIENLGAELGDKIAGLNAALEVLEGKCEALGLDITKLEEALRAEIGTLSETLAAQIASEAAAREAGDAELLKMIEELTKRIDALDLATNLEEFSKFVASAQTQLDALNAFKEKMETDFAALKGKVDGIEAIVNENTAAIDELTGKLNETADKAAKNAADILAQAALIAENTERIGKLESGLSELQQKFEELVGENGDIAALKEFKDQASQAIADLSGDIDEINKRLNALAPLLNTMIFDQLRGLVFVPEAYVGGIESAIAYNVRYNPLYLNYYTETDVYTHNSYKVNKYKTWNYDSDDYYEASFRPATIVSYHMNPKSAVVKFEDLSIVSNYAQVISRASEETSPICLDGSYNDGAGLKIEDGKLSVGITGTEDFYKNFDKRYSGDNKMPVFALQAAVQAKEEVDEDGNPIATTNNITSDYAMFVFKNVKATGIEWYKTAFNTMYREDPITYVYTNNGIDNVLDNGTNATVAYNDEKGLNLVDLLAIAYEDNTSASKKGNAWTNKDWEKCGLKMNFELIDYFIGNNKVSESSWATITEDGVVIPNGDVNGIGHMPLVYVTVTDVNNNPVLNGFLRVKIVPANKYYVTEDAITFADIEFVCDHPKTVTMPSSYNPLKMMLDVTGFSKEVFLANYTPVAAGNVMTQFKLNSYSNNWDELTGEDIIGEITYSGQYKFDWEFLDAADRQHIYQASEDHKGSTYICFKGNSELYPNVYIPLTATVKEKLVFSIGTKNEGRWFRDMTTVLLNVNQPNANTQVMPINTDLNQIWQNDAPAFTRVSGYPNPSDPDLAVKPFGYKYYFTAENNGEDGRGRVLPDPNPKENGLPVEGNNAISYPTMRLYVDNTVNQNIIGWDVASNKDMGDFAFMTNEGEYNNTNLYVREYTKDNPYSPSKTTLIATLDPATGEITYAKTEDAEKYLNMYSSMGGEDRPDAKLEAIVGIVPYSECEVAYKSQNSDFNIAFVRPINIDPNKVYPFADADANGSKNYVFNMLSFSDWRDQDFAGKEWLYGFYNIKSIEPVIEGIYTNIATIQSNPNKFVKASESLVKSFKYAPGTAIDYTNKLIDSKDNNKAVKDMLLAGFGTITYNNSGLNVKQFDVMIPFKVVYELGEFQVYVKCTIKTTLGN